jgi:hypothetical protein
LVPVVQSRPKGRVSKDLLTSAGYQPRWPPCVGGTARRTSDMTRVSVITAIAVLGLSGCVGKPDSILAQMFGYLCGVKPTALCAEQPPGAGEAKESRYCYQSLADATCYNRPDPDRKNQQLGTSGQ